MAGGSSTTTDTSMGSMFAKANAADNAATAQSTGAAQSAAATPAVAPTYAPDKFNPVPQYFNPTPAVQAAPMQSPTLRVPGFQGVANPFYTMPTMNAQQRAPVAQASQLLNQYNTYRQGYQDQLAAAKAADQVRLDAANKAYQDKQAADKAKAEADAARAQQQAQQQSWMSMFGAAGGGIADLYKGEN